MDEKLAPGSFRIVEESSDPVGTAYPSGSFSLAPSREIKEDATDEEIAKESIPLSAAKDLVDVAGGLAGMANQAVMTGVNVFYPGEKNTLWQVGKALYDEYQAGNLLETEFKGLMSMFAPMLERTKAVGEPILDGEFGKAAETMARKPFSYAADIASVAGPVKGMVKGGASVAFGPSTEAISSRVARSASVKNARPYSAIAQDIPDAMATLEGKIKSASKEALATLSDKPADGFPSLEVVKSIDTAKKSIGKVISDSDVAAVDALDRYAKRITKGYKGESISPKDIKAIIQKLDTDIDWSTPKSDVVNKAIKSLRRDIDQKLKTTNEAYGEKMVPLADLVELQQDAQRALGVKKIVGEYSVPDSVTTKLSKVHKSVFKPETRDILKRFGEETGLDLITEAENYHIKELFDKAYPQGSARTNLGATVGGAVGGMAGGMKGAGVGASVGGAMGQGLDRFGGRMLGSAIDIGGIPLQRVGAAIDAVPSGAILPARISADAQQIKADYKAGKIDRATAAKKLRDSGEFK